MHWDGLRLWSADRGTRIVYRHLAGPGLPVAAAYPLGNADPAGLWWAGNMLWVLDRRAGRLRRYRLAPEFGQIDSLELRAAAGVSADGFALHGPDLWVLAGPPPSLARMSLRKLVWSPEPGPPG